MRNTMSRWLLDIAKDRDSIVILGSLCQCSVTLTVKKCFLMFRGNLLCFILCPLPHVLSLGITGKSLDPSIFTPSLQVFMYIGEISARTPSLLFLRAELSRIFSAFHHRRHALVPSSLIAICWTLCSMSMSPL